MHSAQKWILPYQDLYVGYHYFLGIYYLLPFGSSELRVFVNRFFIQEFCFVHSIIYWFVPSFPSRLHSVSFLYSFWCLLQCHSCIHSLLYSFWCISLSLSFILTFIHNSELLLKENNDKYWKWHHASFKGHVTMTFETDMMSCDPDLLVFWSMAHTLKVFCVWAINHSKDGRSNTPD